MSTHKMVQRDRDVPWLIKKKKTVSELAKPGLTSLRLERAVAVRYLEGHFLPNFVEAFGQAFYSL